jgi:hypothetical protein
MELLAVCPGCARILAFCYQNNQTCRLLIASVRIPPCLTLQYPLMLHKNFTRTPEKGKSQAAGYNGIILGQKKRQNGKEQGRYKKKPPVSFPVPVFQSDNQRMEQAYYEKGGQADQNSLVINHGNCF